MAGFHDQGLIPGQLFQIALDQLILHPVLANLTGFSIGYELIWVQGHIKIQIVIDHDLKRPAFDAVALILVDGPALDGAWRPEAITIDSAP